MSRSNQRDTSLKQFISVRQYPIVDGYNWFGFATLLLKDRRLQHVPPAAQFEAFQHSAKAGEQLRQNVDLKTGGEEYGFTNNRSKFKVGPLFAVLAKKIKIK